MSHNPNTVKSQDNLSTTNDGKRSSDVVLSAVEKCERLQKQLDIAVKALELYKNLRGDGTLTNYESIAKQALQQIEELDNV